MPGTYKPRVRLHSLDRWQSRKEKQEKSVPERENVRAIAHHMKRCAPSQLLLRRGMYKGVARSKARKGG